MAERSPVAEMPSYEECKAWADRYASTPWNMLALSTSVDKQPSPLLVMRSLFAEVERLLAIAEAAERHLNAPSITAEIKAADALRAALKSLEADPQQCDTERHVLNPEVGRSDCYCGEIRRRLNAGGRQKPPVEGAETLAARFHEAYERLAPSFGYKPRGETSVPWAEVPDPNRSLMVAVAAEVLSTTGGSAADPKDSCHICHRPKDEPGEIFCSYPHPVVPVLPEAKGDEREGSGVQAGAETGA